MTFDERGPIAASDDDRQALAKLERVLSEADGDTLLATSGPNGPAELPEIAVRLLRDIVHHLARGDAITITSLGAQLSTRETAALLHVPEPYLNGLLERGEIPSERVGPSHWLRREDVLAYMRRRDRNRRASLQELSELSEELGLYDLDIGPADVRNAGRERQERNKNGT